ncbi:hypothetical protein B9K09_03450 [Pseudomonas sp. M30-35]|nr:hypothetical protein B9K09_03450 [Pseudomonas sp. M30-35]
MALVPDAPLDIDALNTSQNLGAIAQGMQDERDLVNQLLGQAQMAGAFEEFSRTVRTSKIAYVKEHKLYRALAGRKSPNGSVFSGTWDEFCQTLGMSADKADMDIANLRAFGEEALESMSNMGIGYRDLRQWRRLPDDARSALIEAAKTDNKEAVIFLAEELIATHTQEKENLSKALTETKADYEAQGDVLANKSAELDKTKLELEKAKRRIQTLSADEAAKELRQEVIGIAFEAEADISGKLREAFATLAVHAEETGTDHRNFKSGLVHQLERLLADIRTEFHLPENTGGNDLDFFTQPEA